MCDILHHTMHSPSKQYLVLIIQRNNDKQFCRSRLLIKNLSQCKLLLLEICGIASRCCVSHMRELTIFLVGKSIQESRRNRTVKDKITLEQFDSFKCLESSRLSWGRFTASDIWTFVVDGIGVRTIWIIFDVGILEIRRSMIVIIHTKYQYPSRKRRYFELPVSPSNSSYPGVPGVIGKFG